MEGVVYNILYIYEYCDVCTLYTLSLLICECIFAIKRVPKYYLIQNVRRSERREKIADMVCCMLFFCVCAKTLPTRTHRVSSNEREERQGKREFVCCQFFYHKIPWCRLSICIFSRNMYWIIRRIWFHLSCQNRKYQIHTQTHLVPPSTRFLHVRYAMITMQSVKKEHDKLALFKMAPVQHNSGGFVDNTKFMHESMCGVCGV